MLVEGVEVFEDVECDVGIIGAGAAGVSIALELRNTRLEVALVESGGLEKEADT